MKRLLQVIAFFILVLLTACTAAPSPELAQSAPQPILSNVEPPAAGAEIAFIVAETQRETTFAVETWSTIGRFSGETGVTSGIYKSENDGVEAVAASVDLAVKGGARLIVAIGDAMAQANSQLQNQYPQVKFLLLDVAGGEQPALNTLMVRFSAEQAGWLAGYAAVWEQANALAFYKPQNAEMYRYAAGFLQGAEVAATERSLEPGSIEAYQIAEEAGETSSLETQSTMANLQNAFAGKVGVLLANDIHTQYDAQQDIKRAGGQTITVDGVATSSSDVLTTVQKTPKVLLYSLLGEWNDGRFDGGRYILAGVQQEAVSLLMEAEKFEYFALLQYDKGLDCFEDGTLAAQLEQLVKNGLPEEPAYFQDMPLEHIRLVSPGVPNSSPVAPGSSTS